MAGMLRGCKETSIHTVSSYVISHKGKAHINIITEYPKLIGANPVIYSPINNNIRCINITKFFKTT